MLNLRELGKLERFFKTRAASPAVVQSPLNKPPDNQESLERLVELMHSKNESVAVRAAEALLDRGYGRPMQGMELWEKKSLL
jgi:hypothetical protein